MENIDHTTAARDARGRFRPGCSGNPAGKKPGTLNRATILKRVMAEGDDARIGRLILERALKDEWGALRFVHERLEPKPRTRPVALDFPEDATAAEMNEIVLRAMAAGEISPEEALQVMRVVDKIDDQRSTARLVAAALALRRASVSQHRPANPPAEAVESAPDLHSASIERKPAARAKAPRHAANAAAGPSDLLSRLTALDTEMDGWADGLQRACNLQL